MNDNDNQNSNCFILETREKEREKERDNMQTNAEATAAILQLLHKADVRLTTASMCASVFPSMPIPLAKTEINRILYQLLVAHQVIRYDDFPPTWEIAGKTYPMSNDSEQLNVLSSSTDNSKACLVILVDLGNVHHVLKPLVPYVQAAEKNADFEMKVFAFADLAFNGYGVNPLAPLPIQVYQSTTADPNAADIEMVWKVAELILLHPKKKNYRFVVVTLDQGFRNLQTIVERYSHSLEFVKNWDALKIFVE